jgi:hypothetical protein
VVFPDPIFPAIAMCIIQNLQLSVYKITKK